MTSPTDYSKKLQELLRQLFQFDCADLDFGIYRIMNFKRAVLDKFIEKDLPRAVSAELDTGALSEQSEVVEQLKEVAKQIRENLGDDAIDGDGNLAPKHGDTKVGRKYLALQARVGGAQSRPALEAAVFNHLYSFFSRYYDAGDFMSKRRYSRKEKFAVPYNGEDVYLHWANKDQYYIKTGEYFADYRFSAPNGVAVHFKIQAADVEKENVKGENRFFIPLAKKAVFDSKTKGIVIPFEYRPLTEQEEVKYGTRNQQEAIIAEALGAVPKHFAKEDTALAALVAERTQTADGQSISYLEHHLRQYSRRNTSDFFIHKDLKGFLTRELDFYLKNEVLGLDELEAGGESRTAGWFQLLHTIKAIGRTIIAFLSQIEDFQKKLFEKRKFILETQYCITVSNIAEEFYPDIAACESQWQEWKYLFQIDEDAKNLFSVPARKKLANRIAFLKNNATLVLDTIHFKGDIIDRLLANFDNLDDITGGLLIHSENFQALSLLQEKYHGKVNCIYIDPPFNTGADFLYKDMFQNSTWLSFLTGRVGTSMPLLSINGNYYMHLDYNAMHYGKIILLGIFSKLNELIYNTNATKDEESGLFSYKSFAPKFVRQHDTILHAFNSGAQFIKMWKPNRSTSKMNLGQLDIISSPIKSNPKSLKDFSFHVERYSGTKLLKPEIKIREKIFPIGDIWNDIYSFTQSEMRTSENVSFPTQKPENLLRRILQSSTIVGDVVMDFFAGSGTTAAVAHKLKRKYIAVEIGEYFGNTYPDYDRESGQWAMKLGLIGRMKNVLHGDESFNACGKNRRSTLSKQIGWKGGGMLKYLRLESYEDALDNIVFDERSGQKALSFDDYLLNYMLDWETKESDTLLNVEKIASPFDYKLRVTQDGQTGEKAVDLPETFNYLLGLNVTTRKVYHDEDRRYLVYRGTVDSRQICAIWRTTAGWSKEDFERDKKFVAEQKIAEGADEIFVNSDSVIPGARSLDPVFKARMFAPVAANGAY